MSKIKVAVIGCGTIANSAHIPAYMKNEEVEIKYFCDIIPEKAEALREKFPKIENTETDYKKVLADLMSLNRIASLLPECGDNRLKIRLFLVFGNVTHTSLSRFKSKCVLNKLIYKVEIHN